MIYKRFEDIPIWQEARAFVGKIYEVILNNSKLKTDYSLSDQLKRASYSILLNISEGFERGSNKDFANFLNIAKGSAGEVRAILYIVKDNEYITENAFKDLYTDVEKISLQLSGFRKFLLKNGDRKK